METYENFEEQVPIQITWISVVLTRQFISYLVNWHEKYLCINASSCASKSYLIYLYTFCPKNVNFLKPAKIYMLVFLYNNL